MNTKKRADEIYALLKESEYWTGYCKDGAYETQALDKLIEALKLTVKLLVDCAYAENQKE